MNHYLMNLIKRLNQDPQRFINVDAEELSELLYNLYRELNPLDSEKIRAVYQDLDKELERLPLREADEIWYQICGLCSEHERDAFLYGIRVGILLGMGR